MWFVSKKNTLKRRKESVPFLRKPLPKRHERRLVSEKEPKRSFSNFLVLLLWLLFFATVAYIFLFSSFTRLDGIEVSGMKNISSERLQESIMNQLSGKYFSIFPRSVLGLVSPHSLEQKLYREYPLIERISVQRIFPNKIQITLSERQYILLWKTGDQQYFVDEEGITHDATFALLEENKPFLLTLSDMSSKPVILGEKVIESRYAEFLTLLSQNFQQRTGIILLPHFTLVSRFADELRGMTSDGYEVYFNTEMPLDTSLNTLSLLLEKELTLKNRNDLQYIDLRTENRVYYAFRDHTEQESSLVVTPILPKEEKKKK